MAAVRVLAAVVVVVLAVLIGWLALGALGPSANVPLAAAGAPHFVEEARAAGVSHVYDGDFEYFVGGGVAAFDCNADQLPDLYFAGGSAPAALFINQSPVGGALRFDRLAGAATDLDAVTGAYPLDIDGDGVTDLAVLRRGPNQLLRGLGDCRFEAANERWAYEGGDAWSTAFSAKWDGAYAWPTWPWATT